MKNQCLPHNLDAEVSLLGAAILAPQYVLQECAGELTADAFYDIRHKLIFSELMGMQTDSLAIDPVTLTERMKQSGQLDNAGGVTYITDLFTRVPSASHFRDYLNIVRQKSALRNAILSARELEAKCYEANGETDEILAEYGQRIQRGLSPSTAHKTHHEACDEAIALLESLYKTSGGALLGISTGWKRMDRKTRGLQAGHYWVIGANSSEGKTTLAAQLALQIAEQGHGVGFVTMEQTSTEIAIRLLSNGSRVNLYGLTYSQDDFNKLTHARVLQNKLPIFYEERGGLSISKIRSSIRHLVNRHKIKVAFVDYIQLADADDKRKSDTEATTEISKGLKQCAKELGITVVAISQFSRDNKKQNRRPRIDDLRQSGQIEQDADLILLILGKAKSDDFETPQPLEHELKNVIQVDVAKHRNGPKGLLPMLWQAEWFRYEEWTPNQKET